MHKDLRLKHISPYVWHEEKEIKPIVEISEEEWNLASKKLEPKISKDKLKKIEKYEFYIYNLKTLKNNNNQSKEELLETIFYLKENFEEFKNLYQNLGWSETDLNTFFELRDLMKDCKECLKIYEELEKTPFIKTGERNINSRNNFLHYDYNKYSSLLNKGLKPENHKYLETHKKTHEVICKHFKEKHTNKPISEEYRNRKVLS